MDDVTKVALIGCSMMVMVIVFYCLFRICCAGPDKYELDEDDDVNDSKLKRRHRFIRRIRRMRRMRRRAAPERQEKQKSSENKEGSGTTDGKHKSVEDKRHESHESRERKGHGVNVQRSLPKIEGISVELETQPSEENLRRFSTLSDKPDKALGSLGIDGALRKMMRNTQEANVAERDSASVILNMLGSVPAGGGLLESATEPSIGNTGSTSEEGPMKKK
uniref:Transmembrane protein n=1 Tax=Angiostrongylus cantonensis TaxID=6313 RepID=A0A0K0DLZ3_ANGCA